MVWCKLRSPLLRGLLSTSVTQRLRLCEGESETYTCQHVCQLRHRALVSVEGEDGKTFLQGFITADMERAGNDAFYSMMLNAQGRVLYDILVYPLSNSSYFLECDSQLRPNLIAHLKKYALRAKVSFGATDSQTVWALFPGEPNSQGQEACFDHILSPDPRFRLFGSRIILSSDHTPAHIWPGVEAVDIGVYHKHRLVSGIPEGVDDIISGRSLPLECNLDYMNGVSFDKGCYLGQELTARTHHTGVVRKRIMPITLSATPDSSIPAGAVITSDSGKTAGRVLEMNSCHGLALMRLSEVSKGNLRVSDAEGRKIGVTAYVPDYWPKQKLSNTNQKL